MKKWMKGLIALLLLVVVLLLVVMSRGGTIIREAVNQAGPKLLGVPVSVQDVTFLPIRGQVKLQNLHVGNPAGYKTAGVFELGLVDIQLKPSSLFSGTVVIESVKIEKPVITYERGLKNSNIGALLDQLEGKPKGESGERKEGGEKPPPAPEPREPPKAPAPAPAPEKKDEGGKKVIIRDLQVNGAQVKVTITALQGAAAPIPLPQVHLTGIGEESKGTSFGAALREIIGAILGAVTDVVTGAGKLVGEGAVAVGGVAVDGVKAVGGVAVDGVKAVGGAAGKITEGIGGLFKGKDEKKDAKKE
jgi:hypothetical protein